MSKVILSAKQRPPNMLTS